MEFLNMVCAMCLEDQIHLPCAYLSAARRLNILCFSIDAKIEKCLSQVSVAMGCAARERNVVFASTLASFFTRAYDQLRMAAISDSNINLCGSHCGLSTG